MQKKFKKIIESQAHSIKKYVAQEIDKVSSTDAVKLKETFDELSSVLQGKNKDAKSLKILLDKISVNDQLQSAQLEDFKLEILKNTADNDATTKDLLQKLQALQDFLYLDDVELVNDFNNVLFDKQVNVDTQEGL